MTEFSIKTAPSESVTIRSPADYRRGIFMQVDDGGGDTFILISTDHALQLAGKLIEFAEAAERMKPE